VDTADIFASSLQKWRLADKQYGLPRAYNTAVMYTNVALFKQAGVPLPSADWKAPGWDFAAFLEACRRLTRRDGEETVQWGASLLNNVFYFAFIYGNGGSLFSPDLNRCTLAERPALDALQYLADLVHGHRVALSPAQTQATTCPTTGDASLPGRSARPGRTGPAGRSRGRTHRAGESAPSGRRAASHAEAAAAARRVDSPTTLVAA
jgi:ABC-type glycerol-3-phosphate transport system substrate-binding protein